MCFASLHAMCPYLAAETRRGVQTGIGKADDPAKQHDRRGLLAGYSSLFRDTSEIETSIGRA